MKMVNQIYGVKVNLTQGNDGCNLQEYPHCCEFIHTSCTSCYSIDTPENAGNNDSFPTNMFVYLYVACCHAILSKNLWIRHQ